jgi:hypothetical protein
VKKSHRFASHSQAIVLNLRVRDDLSKFFRLDGHICEVQLLLRPVSILKVIARPE